MPTLIQNYQQKKYTHAAAVLPVEFQGRSDLLRQETPEVLFGHLQAAAFAFLQEVVFLIRLRPVNRDPQHPPMDPMDYDSP